MLKKFKKKESCILIVFYFRKGSAPISAADNSHKTREEIEREKLEEEEMNNELAKVTLAPTRDDVNLN